MTNQPVIRPVPDTFTFFINNQGEYGTFTLIPASGTLMAKTSFGEYAYSWMSYGDDFVGFLREINYGYAMSKFKGNYGKQFSGEKAVENLKRTIFERRRDYQIDAEEARDAFDELRYYEDYAYTKDTFTVWVRDNAFLINAIGHDEWWYAIDGDIDCPQCLGFWNKLYKPFVEYLQPEMLR